MGEPETNPGASISQPASFNPPTKVWKCLSTVFFDSSKWCINSGNEDALSGHKDTKSAAWSQALRWSNAVWPSFKNTCTLWVECLASAQRIYFSFEKAFMRCGSKLSNPVTAEVLPLRLQNASDDAGVAVNTSEMGTPIIPRPTTTPRDDPVRCRISEWPNVYSLVATCSGVRILCDTPTLVLPNDQVVSKVVCQTNADRRTLGSVSIGWP